jgi:hypothetical protein
MKIPLEEEWSSVGEKDRHDPDDEVYAAKQRSVTQCQGGEKMGDQRYVK